MVAPITLNVRHINGYTFTVGVDHDADALGLKVLIWEIQHIPVDKQRLIFGGKELTDGVTLPEMGITDGGQLFLIESGNDGASAAAVSGQQDVATAGAVHASAVVPPAFSPEAGQVEQGGGVESQSGSFMVSIPQPDSRYELVSDEAASNERVSAAITLAKYVRVYCIFGFIFSVMGTFGCAWNALGALFYLFGWIGTRKLNRCFLVFPMINSFIVGFLGSGGLIYFGIVYNMYLNGIWILAYVIMLLMAFFHIMIFFSILALNCRIRKLSRDEWCTARARIISRHCCC